MPDARSMEIKVHAPYPLYQLQQPVAGIAPVYIDGGHTVKLCQSFHPSCCHTHLPPLLLQKACHLKSYAR